MQVSPRPARWRFVHIISASAGGCTHKNFICQSAMVPTVREGDVLFVLRGLPEHLQCYTRFYSYLLIMCAILLS